MKKLFTLSMLVLFSATYMFAQNIVGTDPENKNVVLEEFTGIHCTYCPQGHQIAQGIQNANPDDVVLINIHTGSYANPNSGEPDFRTPWGDAIAGQSGLTGYPAGTVNRHLFPGMSQGSGTAMSRGNWSAASSQILNEGSYVNVGVESFIDVETRELIVNVEAYYTGDSPESTNLMNVAILQDSIYGPQTGGGAGNNYNHMHMLRHLVTGQWGVDINQTTTGTLYQETFTYTIPDDYNDVEVVLEHLEVVAFVTETTQEIVSGHRGTVSFSGGPDPLTADFIADAPQVCEAGFVWFTSTSLGDPVEWEWLFPGGNPESSMDENPFSYYEDLGDFDVTLIVRDANGDRDTLSKAAFIQVTTEPDVVFGEVEDLCNEDWDPYLLTTGTPVGGSYSGDHVSDGIYFHPTAAGIGDHYVYYTYTDAACGTFVEEQIITVVNCVGVEENMTAIAMEVFPNPTQGMIKLNLEADLFTTADLKVMNTMGQVVYEQNGIKINGNFSTDIDLSEQSQGVYFVVVSGNEQQISKKIFLQN